jgi:hypothetical protein
MTVLALVWALAIGFLVVCLKGFHAALQQGQSFKGILATISSGTKSALPGRHARLIAFPAEMAGLNGKRVSRVRSRLDLRLDPPIQLSIKNPAERPEAYK